MVYESLSIDEAIKVKNSKSRVRLIRNDGLINVDGESGYHALASVLTHEILKMSNAPQPGECRLCRIKARGNEKVACISRGLVNEPVSLEEVYLRRCGKSLTGWIVGLEGSADDRIDTVISQLSEEEIVGQSWYFACQLQADAISCNLNRTMANVWVSQAKDYRDNEIVFGFGDAWYSDLKEYPMMLSPEELVDSRMIQPFCISPRALADAASSVTGFRLLLNFGLDDLRRVLGDASEFYDDSVLQRVERIVRIQMERFPRHFQNSSVVRRGA
jgi:hypothetical protein